MFVVVVCSCTVSKEFCRAQSCRVLGVVVASNGQHTNHLEDLTGKPLVAAAHNYYYYYYSTAQQNFFAA